MVNRSVNVKSQQKLKALSKKGNFIYFTASLPRRLEQINIDRTVNVVSVAGAIRHERIKKR
jgi:hypothetical protein